MWQAQILSRLEPKINTHIRCVDPNHADKDPSCFIKSWHFHCFGCGIHGDPIKFVQIAKGFQTRQEAMAWICEQLHIPLPDSKETDAQKEAIDHKIENLESFWNWSQQEAEPAYVYLEERGVSKETAKKHGIGYIKGIKIAEFLDPLPEEQREKFENEFKSLGLISQSGNLLYSDRITFPITDHGRVINLIGRTLKNADVRPKYIFCAKTELALPDIPWNLDEVRNETTAYLVEGPVDGLTLIDRGVPNVMAIDGTQGLTKSKLRAIKRSKIKTIILIFDRDPNKAGQEAILATGRRLFEAGLIVKAITLPFRKGNQKQDVNSYFCDGATLDEFNALPTRDYFDVLLESTTIHDNDNPMQRSEALKNIYKLVGRLPAKWHAHYIDLISRRFSGLKQSEVEANIKDFHAQHKAAQTLTPYKIKEKLCEKRHVIADQGGGIWHYTNGVYVPWLPQEIGKEAIAIRKRDKSKDPTTFETREVLGFVRDENFVPEENFNQSGFLNVQNGLVNLETGKLEPHKPDLYCTIQLPFAVNPDAQCPIFLQTIKEIFPSEQDRTLLQTIFGYCLTRDIFFHLAFVFTGEGRNGKSLVWRTLQALLSKNNVSHLTLSDMSERFRLVHLRHKLVNVTTEVRSGEKIDDSAFKALVAGESVRVEEKYQKSFEFEPYAKFIVCANNMPKTRDFSDGFFDRLIILPFDQKFEGERVDRHRFEKIVPSELPGIFQWAGRGLARLRKDGQFLKTDSTEAAIQDYKLEVDHVMQFSEDKVVYDKNMNVEFNMLFSHYCFWCEENRFKPKSSKSFGKRFIKISKEKNTGFRVQESNGKRFYKGCNLVDLLSNIQKKKLEREQKIADAPYIRGVPKDESEMPF
jgi:putative DNA primase/helicase